MEEEEWGEEWGDGWTDSAARTRRVSRGQADEDESPGDERGMRRAGAAAGIRE